MDIAFIKSNRFWALILATIVGVLSQTGLLDAQIAGTIITACLGFISVRTVDRFSEKFGEIKTVDK